MKLSAINIVGWVIAAALVTTAVSTTGCSEGGMKSRSLPTWVSTGTGNFEYTFDCIEGKKFMFVRYDYRSLGVAGPFGDCPEQPEQTHESLPEGW